MVRLLKSQFAEEGTNEKKHQEDMYTIFLDYLKVVASKSLTKFSTERGHLQKSLPVLQICGFFSLQNILEEPSNRSMSLQQNLITFIY